MANIEMKEESVDLTVLVKKIKEGKKLIFKVTALTIVIGLIISFTTPPEYQAECKLLPETQSSKDTGLGNVAGIAGLAGIDLSSLTGGSKFILTPETYPYLASSTPFLYDAILDTLRFSKKGIECNALEYFKYHDEGFWSKIGSYVTFGLLEKQDSKFDKQSVMINESYVEFNRTDWDIMQKFKERIRVDISESTGIISILVEMPDPYAAADLALKIKELITKKVIEYKTDKALKSLRFIEKSYRESLDNYNRVSKELAQINDQNINVNTAKARLQLKKIEDEYRLSYEIHSSLANKVEQSKILLNEETPVFTILDPVRLPLGKSSPKRKITMAVSTFLGIFFSCIYLIRNDILKIVF